MQRFLYLTLFFLIIPVPTFSSKTEVTSLKEPAILSLAFNSHSIFIKKDSVLLDKSVEIDTSEYIPDDPDFNLIIASDKGYPCEVIRWLKAGADVNTSPFDGITPLMYASQSNHLEVVKILIKYGADVDLHPDNGITALISAVQADNLDIAEYLIRNGADIDLPDYDDVTPLMHAIASGNYIMSDMLLYYGADYTKEDRSGSDALILASFFGFMDIAKELIDLGCDVNSADNKGFTPLHVAVQNGFIEMVELLLDNGADISAKNNYNFTPLDIAIENGDKEITELLISRGASADQRISISLSPLVIAKKNKTDSLVTLLRNNGARYNYWPNFNKLMLGIDLKWNANDFLSGINFGLSDNKFNIDLYAGYWFRPFAVRVLEQQYETVYYQYWERRAVFSLGLDKKIAIFRPDSRTDLGLLAGVKESFTFGSYRGTETKPTADYITSPCAGLYWRKNFFLTKLTYERMNLDLYKFQKGWIWFSFIFLINRKSAIYSPKYIYWFK